MSAARKAQHRRRAAAVGGIRRQLGLIETFLNKTRDGFPAPTAIAMQKTHVAELHRQLEELEAIAAEVRG